jgi:hypothetical protein
MSTQFITNEKGKKMAVIIPINEYEDLLHQHHLDLELTEEENGQANYTSFQNIKNSF